MRIIDAGAVGEWPLGALLHRACRLITIQYQPEDSLRLLTDKPEAPQCRVGRVAESPESRVAHRVKTPSRAESVWMYAATRRCGYPADSSDLVTGASERLALLPLPLHSSGAGWIAACGSCPAQSRPATRSAHPWRARATNKDSETYQRSCARQPGRHWAAGSGSPQCQLRPSLMVQTCLRSVTISPLTRQLGRLRTVSAEANCIGLSMPIVYDSPTARRARGQGAHSVSQLGQGLTVTAAPTSYPHTPVCHRSTGSVAHSLAPALS